MNKGRIPIGIQLYSLRDVIGADVPGTLKQLAAMGYQGVELAGTYGLSAEALRALLDENGLTCAGAHVGIDQLEGDALGPTVDFYKTLGTDRLIVPSADLANLDVVLERFQAAHPQVTAAGMRMGFHNHKAEFEPGPDGVSHFDRIFQTMPKDFLVQLDIGWAVAAGQDVPAILRKYAIQVETVHVKEFNPEDHTAVVGEGAVDWPSVLDVLEAETAVQWYVVEQEQYQVGPMESARDCIDNLRRMGR